MVWSAVLFFLVGLAAGAAGAWAWGKKVRDREEALLQEVREKGRSLADARARLATLETELKASRKAERGLVRRDDLTGLHNKKAFNEVLSDEWRRGFRYGASISLLLIHVRSGDGQRSSALDSETVSSVGALIGESLQRPGDTTARLGRQTFGAILSGTDAEGAAEAGEILRSKLEARQTEGDKKVAAPALSVHIGAATAYPGKGLSVKSLVAAAAGALRKARAERGGRVALADMLWPE